MKSEIGLQFSTVVRGIVRTAGWVALTVAVGLILVIACGSPLAAFAPAAVTAPGTDHVKKTGPWVYMPIDTRV